ncbi:MAG: quinate 5-dehydrogenase [Armatimonadota bacterium]
MKHIVSVSLGSSQRNKSATVDILGEQVQIERRGTDGDKALFQRTLEELDGHVDAIGLGGCDRYVWTPGRRYEFRDIARLSRNVTKTPIVDGSGLKNTLERTAVEKLGDQEIIQWSDDNVLVVAGVDRFGMAEAISLRAKSVVFGDAMFAINLPLPIHSLRTLKLLADILLPIVTLMPFEWVYPVGKKQEESSPKFEEWFRWADVIAGDWLFIKRYSPTNLKGKTILTNTVRQADVDMLKERGASRLFTTTPVFGGETFATNVLEALIVAFSGKGMEPLSALEYAEWLTKLNWKIGHIEL